MTTFSVAGSCAGLGEDALRPSNSCELLQGQRYKGPGQNIVGSYTRAPKSKAHHCCLNLGELGQCWLGAIHTRGCSAGAFGVAAERDHQGGSCHFWSGILLPAATLSLGWCSYLAIVEKPESVPAGRDQVVNRLHAFCTLFRAGSLAVPPSNDLSALSLRRA